MKLHNYFFLILIALLGCQPSPEELMEKSRSLLDKGEYQEAIEYLNRLLEQDPEYATAYNARGVAYINLKNHEDAISDFSQAIKHDTTSDYKPYYNRANAYREVGDLPAALEDYNKVIEKSPNLADAYMNRSAVLFAMNETESAHKDLEKALELNPNNVVIRVNLARVFLKEGKPTEAREQLDQALQQDNKNATAYYLLGLLELTQENKETACDYFNRGKKLGSREAEEAVNHYCKS